MGIVFGLMCIAMGIAMFAIPGFGRVFVKFQNDLRGNETKEDTSSAVAVQATTWLVVGIVLMIAL